MIGDEPRERVHMYRTPPMSDGEIRRRAADCRLFIAAVEKVCRLYDFGIESHGGSVEIYDRLQPYQQGKPFAVLQVDDYRLILPPPHAEAEAFGCTPAEGSKEKNSSRKVSH